MDSLYDVSVQQDVLYGSADPFGPVSIQDLRMDIYSPLNDSQTCKPVILYAFGGAFLVGDKRQPNIPQFCETFAQRGFVVAAIDYRIGFNVVDQASAERAVYRAVQDLRAAARFLAENYQAYGIDTGSFIYSGSSAGCFAGLHSAFMDDSERPGSVLGSVFEPNDLGCGNCSGNNDYNGKTPGVIAVLNQWGAIIDTAFIDDFPKDSVPLISFHGTADLAVPYNSGNPFFYPIFPVVDGSAPIHKRLTNLGVFNQLVPLQGAGHEPQLINQSLRDTIFEKGSAFLYEVLRPKPGTLSGPKAVCQGDSSEWVLPVKSGVLVHWYLDSNFLESNNGVLKLRCNDTGSHSLYVMAENKYGAQSNGGRFPFFVHPAPKAGFSVSSIDSMAFIVDSSVQQTSSIFFWGDGGFGTDSLHSYKSEGDYTILQVTENGFCRDSFSASVYIDYCPISQFAYTAFSQGYIFDDRSLFADSMVWDFGDGSPISFDPNPYHAFSSPGTFTVRHIAMDANCQDTSKVDLTSKFTNVSEFNDDEFSLFPNPSNGELSLSGPSGYIYALQLLDLSGKVVYKRSELRLPATLGLPVSLSSGLYLLELSRDKEVIQMKFNLH